MSCVFVPVDLALWSSVSINALYTPCARNLFGLALGMGKAGELTGVSLGVLGQAAEHRVRGVQIAGLVVAGGEDVIGIQVAGLVAAAGDHFAGLQASAIAAAGDTGLGVQLGALGAAAGDEMSGLQLGGLFAASGSAMTGLQAGGLFAASGDQMAGIQIGGLFAAAGDAMTGLQLGGLFAAAGNTMTGLQLGGLFSAAAHFEGVQLSPGASRSGGGRGLEIAGVYTRATGDLTGGQLALVNLGTVVTGAQIGLVNIAREVHGVQLGLVNVADHADAPLGLVSWMRRGDRAVEVAGGEALPVMVAARLGTDRVYSLLGVGADPVHDRKTWGPGGGFGVRIPVAPVAIHIDALAHAVLSDGVDHQALLAQARVRVAVPVAPHVAVLAGATWNVLVSDDDDGADLPLGLERVAHDGDTVIRQWPGVSVGAAFDY